VAFVEKVVISELQKATKLTSSVVESSKFGPSGIYLVTKEAARDVNLFTPDDNNFLPVKNLLGDNRSESTQEMALSINYDGGRRDGGHVGV
jgi:hypothetical protein